MSVKKGGCKAFPKQTSFHAESLFWLSNNSQNESDDSLLKFNLITFHMKYIYVGSLLSVEKSAVFSKDSPRNAIEVIPSFLVNIFIVAEALLEDFFL